MAVLFYGRLVCIFNHLSTDLKVYGIERTINSSVDLPMTWQSYFMEDWYVYLTFIDRIKSLRYREDNKLISRSSYHMAVLFYGRLVCILNLLSTELKVYGIERTINSSVDLPTTWQSYFMEDWYVSYHIYHKWIFD